MTLRKKLVAQDAALLPILELIPKSATDEQIYFYIWAQDELIAERVPVPKNRNEHCVEMVRNWIIADVESPTNYTALHKLRPLAYKTSHFEELIKYATNRAKIFTPDAIKKIEAVLGFNTPNMLASLLAKLKRYPVYQQYALVIAYFLYIEGAFYNKKVFINFICDGPVPPDISRSARTNWAQWGNIVPRFTITDLDQKPIPLETASTLPKLTYTPIHNTNQLARSSFFISSKRIPAVTPLKPVPNIQGTTTQRAAEHARKQRENEAVAQKRSEEEQERKRREDEAVQKQREEEECKRHEEEQERKQREEEECKRHEEEQERKRRENEAVQKQREEQERKQREEEAAQKQREEEERKRHEEQDRKRREEATQKRREAEERKRHEEQERKRREEEQERKRHEEQERKRREEEQERKRREEEQERKRREEEVRAEQRRKAGATAKKQREEEARAEKKRKEEIVAQKRREEEITARKQREEKAAAKKQKARKEREEEIMRRREEEATEKAKKQLKEDVVAKKQREEMEKSKRREEAIRKQREEAAAVRKQFTDEEEIARKYREEELKKQREAAARKQRGIVMKRPHEEIVARKHYTEEDQPEKREKPPNAGQQVCNSFSISYKQSKNFPTSPAPKNMESPVQSTSIPTPVQPPVTTIASPITIQTDDDDDLFTIYPGSPIRLCDGTEEWVINSKPLPRSFSRISKDWYDSHPDLAEKDRRLQAWLEDRLINWLPLASDSTHQTLRKVISDIAQTC